MTRESKREPGTTPAALRGLLRPVALRSDLAERFQQFFAFGNRARFVHLGKTNNTFVVKHIGRALVETFFFVQHAVRLANRSMRPVIGQQRERQTAELFGPCLEAGDGICADLQNFNI